MRWPGRGCCLSALPGWGRLTGKFLQIGRLPCSVACAVGIATVVFLGGLLNLAHAIYTAVLLAIVGLGVLFYLWLRKERPQAYRWSRFWNSASKWPRLIVIITLLILIGRVAATVRLGEFRVEDDGSAYLVYPQKMLAAHHFASDPFSDRRVISSVGGSYLLQAMVIAATSLPHIGMADRTLGLALMFLALLDLGIAFGLSPPRIAAMELIAYLVPQETFNLTFSILPIALFLAMIWAILGTIGQADNRRWRYAALMGFIGGAIISLKSTYLPYVGALALIPYLALFWRKRTKQIWSLPVIAGIGALIVMAAWMIAMKYASGTYLFPVLGHGVDYSSYDLFHSVPKFRETRALVRVFPQGIALLILAAVQYLSGINTTESRISFAVLIAAALAITAFNYESGADYIWRYNFPQFFTAILTFFIAEAAVAGVASISQRAKLGYIVAIISLIGCIFYYDFEGGTVRPFQRMGTEMRLYRCNLRASLSGMQLVSPTVRARYRAVEAVLPPGAVALDVTTNSFLLTNRNNRKILLDDWAGAASPAPGWPFTNDPEAVPAFLERHSVHYVIYGYEYASWFDMRSCQSVPNESHFSEVDHALQILNFITHHQFDQLRARYKSIYDDGKIAVIDVDSPKSSSIHLGPAWTLGTSETQMCSDISRRYMASHTSDTSRNRSSPCS